MTLIRNLVSLNLKVRILLSIVVFITYNINNAIKAKKETYTGTVNVVTRKCYRCKQVKDIDCFKRCYYTGKHSYCYVKYMRRVLNA